MRDAGRSCVVVDVHADPRCQAILEQIRERESEQAIDRLRLIHRERPARVILLSNVVLDIAVDRLVTWRGLMPVRLAVAAARLDGVLPLAPRWLTARFPDLWGTANSTLSTIRSSYARTSSGEGVAGPSSPAPAGPLLRTSQLFSNDASPCASSAAVTSARGTRRPQARLASRGKFRRSRGPCRHPRGRGWPQPRASHPAWCRPCRASASSTT